MDAFLSKVKDGAAKVKDGVANMNVESLEARVVGKMSKALEHVEQAGNSALAAARGEDHSAATTRMVGTPNVLGTPCASSTPQAGTPMSSGKRTLDSLSREDQLSDER